MRKHLLLIATCYCGMLLQPGIIQAQTHSKLYVNKVFTEYTGVPDVVHWSKTTIDVSGKAIITGNTTSPQTGTNILVSKYNQAGALEWNKQFNGGASGVDYGINSVTDIGGNIYTIGAMTNQNTGLDIFLARLDAYGNTVWSTTWGTDSLDAPTDIKIDGSGNVYVAGTTKSATHSYDFVVLKYDNSGTLQWTYTYDYAGREDACLGIELGNNDNVMVTGASANSSISHSIATILLNPATGAEISVHRVDAPALASLQPTALTKDNNGNFYVGGYVYINGQKDIQITKIDPNLAMQWTQYFDAYGFDDQAVALSCDNSGNIYIAAQAETSAGIDEVMLLKLLPNGNEQWRQYFHNPDYNSPVETRAMVVNNGMIYLTGKLGSTTGNSNFVTLAYDENGINQWMDIFDGSSFAQDDPHDLEHDTYGNIYVTGLSQNGTLNQYATVKYATYLKAEVPVLDANSKPQYVNNELILSFREDLLNKSFIDNEDRQFASLSDVLQASAATDFYKQLELTPDSRITVFKIHPRFTTADSLSISLLGDTVKMPAVWKTLLVSFPTSINIVNALSSLQTLSNVVTNGSTNGYAFLCSNDPYYNNLQQGLKGTYTSSLAGINIDPAWNIETGDSSIRVGVYDSHIWWPHEDFGNGTYAGSSIKGGWNYYSNAPLTTSGTYMTDESHGTSVAGIIAANRDNNKGIGGIAGGTTTKPGISLYSMVLMNGLVSATNATIQQAIVEGAYKSPVNPNKGFGLHIQNHSWATGAPADSNYMFEAAQVAQINGCLMVASSGNDGLNGQWRNFPAGLSDRLVLAVGASGKNGKPLHSRLGEPQPNGDGLFLTNDTLTPIQNDHRFWATSYFNGVDVIAPGCAELVTTGYIPGKHYFFVNDLNDSLYTRFLGTSAAAPHVSGLAALMMSRHRPANGYPNVLAPEDVEFLIEKYAHDVTGNNADPVDFWTYATGYDIYSGHGLADAGEVMKKINWPDYYVLHNGEPDSRTVSVKGSATPTLLRDINGVPGGGITYATMCYEIKHVYHHTFSPDLQIMDYWSRWGGSEGTFFSNQQNGQLNYVDCDFVQSGNNLTVTAKTYVYRVNDATSPHNGKWFPNDTIKRKTAYSVYLRKDATTGLQDQIRDGSTFTIYPNPAATNRIAFDASLTFIATDARLEVTNMLGQVIYSKKLVADKKIKGYIELPGIAPGMYMVNLHTEKGTISNKLIIQN